MALLIALFALTTPSRKLTWAQPGDDAFALLFTGALVLRRRACSAATAGGDAPLPPRLPAQPGVAGAGRLRAAGVAAYTLASHRILFWDR